MGKKIDQTGTTIYIHGGTRGIEKKGRERSIKGEPTLRKKPEIFQTVLPHDPLGKEKKKRTGPVEKGGKGNTQGGAVHWGGEALQKPDVLGSAVLLVVSTR